MSTTAEGNEPVTVLPVEDTKLAPTSEHKITVHHLNNSRSQRILWLLEELDIPYEIKKYTRTAEHLAPKEFKEVHPLGKAPVITDGEVTLAESGAIVEYLISKYGDKLKPSEKGYLDNLYFTHYAEGSLMPLLVNKLIFSLIPKRSPFLIRPIANVLFSGVTKAWLDPQLKTHQEFIIAHLEKCQTGWFANEDHPTAADFQMFFALEGLLVRQHDANAKIKEFVDKVRERPAYKRALEKGGAFALLPPE